MASKGGGSRGIIQQPHVSGQAVAPKVIDTLKSMMMTAKSAILNDAVTGPKSSVNVTAANKSKQNNGGRGNKGHKLPSEKILDMVAKLPKIPIKRENYSDAAKLAVVEIVAECGSVEGAVNIFKRQKVGGYEKISWHPLKDGCSSPPRCDVYSLCFSVLTTPSHIAI